MTKVRCVSFHSPTPFSHSLANPLAFVLIYCVSSSSFQHDSGHLKLSPIHKMWGEAFGVVCWVWVFHRARHDGPVVLGWRHPWDHVEDPWKVVGETVHADDEKDLEKDWDVFLRKVSLVSLIPKSFCDSGFSISLVVYGRFQLTLISPNRQSVLARMMMMMTRKTKTRKMMTKTSKRLTKLSLIEGYAKIF